MVQCEYSLREQIANAVRCGLRVIRINRVRTGIAGDCQVCIYILQSTCVVADVDGIVAVTAMDVSNVRDRFDVNGIVTVITVNCCRTRNGINIDGVIAGTAVNRCRAANSAYIE